MIFFIFAKKFSCNVQVSDLSRKIRRCDVSWNRLRDPLKAKFSMLPERSMKRRPLSAIMPNPLRMIAVRIILLGFVWLTIACVRAPHLTVEPLPRYDAVFDRTDGWIGADGAYSTPLRAGRILWLFGDTFVGTVRSGRRVDAALVNNSIAVQTGEFPADVLLRFYTGGVEGAPGPFFESPDGRGWLWPYHGVLTPGGLFLFLMQIERSQHPGGLGFELIGAWLGQVGNPRDPPTGWRATFSRIPHSAFGALGDRLFGSCVLKEDGYLYIYGTAEKRTGELRLKSMVVARVPEAHLADFSSWRFYAQGGWVREAERAEALCGNVANEFSVTFLAGLNRYVAVYSPAGFSEDIVIRTAPHPYGPWTDPRVVFRCPEAARDREVFCYAAKAHPALSKSAHELIITYVTNSMDFAKIEGHAELYRPRFLRLNFR
jgi:hypothetical protein